MQLQDHTNAPRKEYDRPLPPNIRLATQADEMKLHDCLMRLYANNWMGFPVDDGKVWDVIRHCCRGGGGFAAIIEQDDKIVATTGLVFSKFWYSNADYLSELWLFVDPDYRQAGHAEALVDFLHWLRDQCRASDTGRALPLVTSVTSHIRLKAKMRWWSRWSKLVGAIFVVDGA